MRYVIGLIIIIGLAMGAYQLYEYWGQFKEKEPETVTHVQPVSSGDQLPGMPPKLQPLLDVAQKRGAAGLHDFLATYGKTIDDPRKAWIELDYVVLLAQSSPGEARQKFHEIESRVQPGSPVYSRIQQLAKTYE